MKKKLIYVMLVACCTLSLCACFKSDAEQVAEELGMDVEDAEEISEYINGDRYEPVEEEVVEEIAATDEIISAEKYTNKVQIGGKVYTFPLTVSDLLASGELKLEPARANENTTENTLVAPGEGQSFKLVGPGVKLIMSAGNSTDAMIELKDCVVNAPDIYGDTNIVFSGGLRTGMTLDELTELYGEPDYFDTKENQYFYCEDMFENNSGYIDSRTGYYYRITINMDTGCISSIRYFMGEARE